MKYLIYYWLDDADKVEVRTHTCARAQFHVPRVAVLIEKILEKTV